MWKRIQSKMSLRYSFKQNTCEKCNYGCKTKWAWINKGEVNEKCIHINDYNNREKYKELITCNKGHKLVFAEGERRHALFST